MRCPHGYSVPRLRVIIGVPPLLDAFSALALWSVLPDAPYTLARDTSYACVADSCWMGMHWRGERDGTPTAEVSHGLRRRRGRPAARETRLLRRMLVREHGRRTRE